jgi:hypothetical protein
MALAVSARPNVIRSGWQAVRPIWGDRLVRIAAVVAIVGATCPALTHAATIRVPADRATIQQAIEVATGGDTILVAPGTYQENINFLGKAITVQSEAGADATVIDGGHAESVASFVSAEGASAVLSGFTLRNGFNSLAGGGIQISYSSPTITHNIVVDNAACAGAGISINFGSPRVQQNTILNNAQAGCTGGGGGGISIGGAGSALIVENTISGNATGGFGGGISLFAAGTPTITRNIISGNTTPGSGGGISMVNQSDAMITGNLIAGNTAGTGGGVYWLVPSGARGPFLVNNTIADNASSQGSGIFADAFDAQALVINNIVVAPSGQTAVLCGSFNDTNPPIFRNNIVFSSGGSAYSGCGNVTGTNGNLAADPLFAGADHGDYHVRRGSPSIDAGDNNAPGLPASDLKGFSRILDGDGNGTAVVDMGVYEFSARTLTVTLQGPGVVASPGIACPSDCSEDYDGGAIVVLTASSNGGEIFTTWTGCDETVGTRCTVTMASDRSVMVLIDPVFTLSLVRSGSGIGTVSSLPSGISCGSDCSEQYRAGSAVVLTATPAIDSVFVGWAGPCSGTSACNVTIAANTVVTATFGSKLSVTPEGSVDFGRTVVGSAIDQTFVIQNLGGGTLTGNAAVAPPFTVVSGAPFTLAAGASQSLIVRFTPASSGTASTLLAVTSSAGTASRSLSGTGLPDVRGIYPGFGVLSQTGCADLSLNGTPEFSGLFNIATQTGESVAGSATLTYTINAQNIVASVTFMGLVTAASQLGASFSFTSTVNGSPGGSGSGTFTGSVTGLEFQLQFVSQVTGGCTVVGLALATAISKTLTISKTGTGNGTIASTPAGIDCGSICTQDFRDGLLVTLTATPDASSSFKQWSGACGGSLPTCVVALTVTRAVRAQFTKMFTDATLAVGATLIRAAHVLELRVAIDALRVQAGLPPFAWSDPDLSAGVTWVKAGHVTDLRTAVSQLYQAAGGAVPRFTDATLTPGITLIRALHLEEVRAAVRGLE